MKLVITSPKLASQYAGERILALLKDNPSVHLGLATGSTPLGIYEYLAKAHENGVSFAQVTTFNLDEYLGLAPDHPQSYRHFMEENLFRFLDIPAAHTHVPSGVGDGRLNAGLYERMLGEKGGVDYQILGLGSDGHIGFNEPGTAFDSPTHVTDLAASTIRDNARFFAFPGEVPHQAITMGLATIMKAKEIVLLAFGRSKAQAVRDMVYGPISESCPASILRKHKNVTVYVDEEAFSLCPHALTECRIVTPKRIIERGYLTFDHGQIEEVGEGDYAGSYSTRPLPGFTLMPGYIDIHIHGVAGIDFMKATPKDFAKAAGVLASEGVTGFLATTLTAAPKEIAEVCRRVKAAKDSVPSLLGLHLEGPFLSPEYAGAQNKDFLMLPDKNWLEKWDEASGHNIRLLTLAPELEGAMDLISYADALGIATSAGHSAASFAVAEEAIGHGLRALTHAHNAMSPHAHRKPGLVTAGMYFDSLYTEMILDGIHVAPETVKAWYKVVGPERFVIITDALSAKHGGEGYFMMAGLPAHEEHGAAYLADGTLAGSLLCYDQAVRHFASYTGAGLLELAKVASGNPAKELGLAELGALAPKKRADVVILNDSLQVRGTIVQGALVFHK